MSRRRRRNGRLLPCWRRKLTHGYGAWCTYAAGVLHVAANNIDAIAQALPWWILLVLLGAGLGLSLVKQDTVSGA